MFAGNWAMPIISIALLGDSEMEATSFFVVNTEIRPGLVKTGSSKYKENANFPMDERALPQRTLGSIVADRGQTFQLLKLDVQGAELDVLRGLGDELSKIEVILMEMSLVDYNKGAPLYQCRAQRTQRNGFRAVRHRRGTPTPWRTSVADRRVIRAAHLPPSSAPAVLELMRRTRNGGHRTYPVENRGLHNSFE